MLMMRAMAVVVLTRGDRNGDGCSDDIMVVVMTIMLAVL